MDRTVQAIGQWAEQKCPLQAFVFDVLYDGNPAAGVGVRVFFP